MESDRTLREKVKDLLDDVNDVCVFSAIHGQPYVGRNLNDEFMGLIASERKAAVLEALGRIEKVNDPLYEWSGDRVANEILSIRRDYE